MLDNIDGSSSMAASLSMVVELLEGRINTTATNGSAGGPGLPMPFIGWKSEDVDCSRD
jgi:hypothetical protein